MSGYISPEVKLWAFRAFLFLRQATLTTWNVGSALASAAYGAFQPNVYLFYPEYLLPVTASKFSSEGPGTARPFWTYNPSTRVFSKSQSADDTVKRFPFLSAQITFNSMNLYSLDDFLGAQQFVGELPPPLVLIGAWCLSTGTILDKTIDLKLCVINEDGEEKQYCPWNKSWSGDISTVSVSVNTGTTTGASKSTNTTSKLESSNMGNYVEADSFEDNSAAAYPISFEFEENFIMKNKVLHRFPIAEPVTAPSSLGFVDLSENSMKLE